VRTEPVSRRAVLVAALATVSVLVAAGRRRSGPAEAAELAPTPACDDQPTPEQTEGPYWTPQSPERSDFSSDGAPGPPMVLSGTVLTTTCAPVAGAVVDLWQADGNGVYDNEGYRLRGHVFTDSAGGFRFVTVKPGLYPGRTRHFHVKVQAPGGPVLTTQLYFPGEPFNDTDPIYRPELEMALRDGEPTEGTFTFVVRT
jgi:protocatechuate 3,4-dioxygenase beta subunit